MTAEAAKLLRVYQNEVLCNASKKVDDAMEIQRSTQENLLLRIEDNIDKANARLEFSTNSIGACLALKTVKKLQNEYNHAERLIQKFNQVHAKLKNGTIKPSSIDKVIDSVLSTEKKTISLTDYSDKDLLEQLKSGEIVKIKEEELVGEEKKSKKKKLFGKRKKKHSISSSKDSENFDDEESKSRNDEVSSRSSDDNYSGKISLHGKLLAYPAPSPSEQSLSESPVTPDEVTIDKAVDKLAIDKLKKKEKKKKKPITKSPTTRKTGSIGCKLVTYKLNQPYGKIA